MTVEPSHYLVWVQALGEVDAILDAGAEMLDRADARLRELRVEESGAVEDAVVELEESVGVDASGCPLP